MNNTKAKELMRALVGYEATGIFARTVVPWEILLRGKVDVAADILKREIQELKLKAGDDTELCGNSTAITQLAWCLSKVSIMRLQARA